MRKFISVVAIIIILFLISGCKEVETVQKEPEQAITGHAVYEETEIQDQEQPIGTPPQPPGFQIPEIEMVSLTTLEVAV